MRIRGIIVPLPFAALLLAPVGVGAEAVIVWQGDAAREISIVDLEVHERENAEVLIAKDFARDPTGETKRETFPELFRIDLSVTRRSADENGFALPAKVSPLGTISVATFLGREAARAAIRDVIHSLQIRSPNGFRFPMPREGGPAA